MLDNEIIVLLYLNILLIILLDVCNFLKDNSMEYEF